MAITATPKWPRGHVMGISPPHDGSIAIMLPRFAWLNNPSRAAWPLPLHDRPENASVRWDTTANLERSRPTQAGFWEYFGSDEQADTAYSSAADNQLQFLIGIIPPMQERIPT